MSLLIGEKVTEEHTHALTRPRQLVAAYRHLRLLLVDRGSPIEDYGDRTASKGVRVRGIGAGNEESLAY